MGASITSARSDRATLLRLLADAEGMVATIKAALAVLPNDDPLAPLIEEDEAPLKRIAHEVGRTPDCIRRWVITHNLGRMCGGRWLVSRRRLRDFMGTAETV
jgi:hypothetical protein